MQVHQDKCLYLGWQWDIFLTLFPTLNITLIMTLVVVDNLNSCTLISLSALLYFIHFDVVVL